MVLAISFLAGNRKSRINLKIRGHFFVGNSRTSPHSSSTMTGPFTFNASANKWIPPSPRLMRLLNFASPRWQLNSNFVVVKLNVSGLHMANHYFWLDFNLLNRKFCHLLAVPLGPRCWVLSVADKFLSSWQCSCFCDFLRIKLLHPLFEQPWARMLHVH